MARFLNKTTKQQGLPPGTLIFSGEQKMEQPLIRVMDFNLDKCSEREVDNVEEIAEYEDTATITWVNIDGVHEVDIVEKAGQFFKLSALLLEDVVNTGQRPKIIEYEDFTFIVLKMLRFDEKSGKIIAEQLSLVISKKFLLTFQEQRGDVFEPIRERIRSGRKRIRSFGPDFLAYCLLDVVCENYIHIIEVLGEQIEDLEEELLDDPKKELPHQINRFKQEINYLRKCIRPVREVIARIPKTENATIKKHSFEYWRDLQELAVHANEAIDSYRDVLADHLNLYHTTMSTKMNDIMKVLTIFAAIFIPLTFIAGIYGTNFEVLPELHYRYSYFIMLGFMALVAVGMLIYFRKQKWF
ncbi:MAG: cobalt/magnesium transport protein CorA [Cyclobacteriaceae bacterium]|nr:MAG: cobalt/magnesium transport protein CorA [Cyclobacteriaceae bacterium]